MFGYVHKFIDEKEAIDVITQFKLPGTTIPDLRMFSNLLFDPVGYEGSDDDRGYYLAKNLPRDEFDLNTNGRAVLPGDFDIILIPFSRDKLFFDRTAVFEVKIARPNAEAPNKPTKSLGTKQVWGLIEDGFPLVGLLHICMPEPLSEKNATKLKFYKYPIGEKSPLPANGFAHPDNFEFRTYDWLPGFAINTQMQRMITSGLPKFVGIDAIALSLTPDDGYSTTLSRQFNGFRSGYFNPQKDVQTIRCIEAHFLKYGLQRYTKLDMTG